MPLSAQILGEAIPLTNRPPTAQPADLATVEDTSASVELRADDLDSDALSLRVGTAPAHGTVTLVDGVATYVPSPDYSGEDQFSFVADDGLVESAPAWVTVVVQAVNDPPSVADQAAETLSGIAVQIPALAVDVDDVEWTFQIVTAPTNG